MKKIALILLLITSLFILKINTTYASEVQIITYQNHLGTFLGYVEIDKDLYDYENWNPAQYGLEFVYRMENHIFIGWQDEDGNLYADVDYDVVQGQYDTFRAAFEYSLGIENPVEPLPTPVSGTWTQTSIEMSGVRQYTVNYTYPKSISVATPIDIILKYTYVEGVYSILNRIDESFPYHKYRNDLYNHSESYIALSNVYTIGANSLILMIWTEISTDSLTKLTEFIDSFEFYEVEQAYYVHNMLQNNLPTESITQEMLDREWQNGYLHAVSVLADYYWTQTQEYIEQARNEGYNEGVAVNIDVKSFFEQVLDGISGIFTMVIMPGFTVGAFVMIPISFGLFKWFMKIFGGRA